MRDELARTLVVPGALPRYQVRQHLKLNGIQFTEEWENDAMGATFTFVASEEVFAEVQAFAEKVKW